MSLDIWNFLKKLDVSMGTAGSVCLSGEAAGGQVGSSRTLRTALQFTMQGTGLSPQLTGQFRWIWSSYLCVVIGSLNSTYTTCLHYLLSHEKVSTDVKKSFTHGSSQFSRKCLQVFVLERIMCCRKRQDGLDSAGGATLRVLKKV